MKKILVLAPHDLVLDPRVKWMAESLAFSFLVSAIGIKQVDRAPRFDRAIEICQLESQSFNPFSAIFNVIHIFPLHVLLVGMLALIPALLAFPLVFALKYSMSFPKLRAKVLGLMPGVKSTLKESVEHGSFFKLLGEIRLLFYLIKHFLIVSQTFISHFKSTPLDRPDFVIANDLDSLIPAIFLKRKFKSTLIYDAHEFYPYQFPGATKFLISVLAFIEKSLLPEVDHIITVTPQLAQEIKQKYGIKNEVFAIPNCAPLEEVAASKFSRNTDKKVFLFQGNFSKGRGLEKLVEYWSRLNPENAVLVMRGPDCQFKSKCEELAGELGVLNTSLFFESPVTEEELIKAASVADIGVIPYEATSINNLNCCPNKLSQYLQSGIAVLGNDLPFVTSILAKSNAGLSFQISSYESFSDNVNRLINEKDLLSNMKLLARAFAENEYNWNIVSAPVFEKIFGFKK